MRQAVACRIKIQLLMQNLPLNINIPSEVCEKKTVILWENPMPWKKIFFSERFHEEKRYYQKFKK